MLCVDVRPSDLVVVAAPADTCPYVLMTHAEVIGVDVSALGVTPESVAYVFAWGFGAVILAWGLGWGIGVVKRAIGKF